jgi:ATP:corrinoid adenosyltransferase
VSFDKDEVELDELNEAIKKNMLPSNEVIKLIPV